MRKLLAILTVSQLLSGSALAGKAPKPAVVVVPQNFKSDGCSVFPDGNYRECCVEHDNAYYVGGSWRKRLQADNALYSCVSHKQGLHHKIVAPLMWFGVRVGGVGFLPTRIRWGFGR